MQALLLIRSPFTEQGSGSIFAQEVSPERLFEGSPEEHRRSGVFLLPAIQVAVTISSGAGQVLADLGVAVCHSKTSRPMVLSVSGVALESSCHRAAGANPSRLSSVLPLSTVWVISTTP